MLLREPRVHEEPPNDLRVRVGEHLLEGVPIGAPGEALSLAEREHTATPVVRHSSLVFVVGAGEAWVARHGGARPRPEEALEAEQISTGGLFAEALHGSLASRLVHGCDERNERLAGPGIERLGEPPELVERVGEERRLRRQEELLGVRLPKLGVTEGEERTDELFPTHFALDCSRRNGEPCEKPLQAKPCSAESPEKRPAPLPSMSANDPKPPNPDLGEELDVETVPVSQVPRRYKVIFHNDDYTTMEFVIEVLQRFFHKTATEAMHIMLTVHKKGAAVACVTTRDVAETKTSQVMDYAQENGMPLLVTSEPE